MHDEFRQKVRTHTDCVGAFIKTSSHQIVELLQLAGLDFAIVDAEHAPFDMSMLDSMALAARALNFPLLLRPHAQAPALISQGLDMGFTGIVQPHIDDRARAEALIAETHFKGGRRGFSPSTRAGNYGAMGHTPYLEAADKSVVTFAQIEDAAGVENIDDIASVNGVDCLFVGRADLAVSLNLPSPQDPGVASATAKVAAAGKAKGRALGIFTGDMNEIPALRAQGFTVFVCGTDQSWLLKEARAVAQNARRRD